MTVIVDIKLTVGLPASKLGGVFPKGEMLLRELLLLLMLGMCFGVVVDKLFRPEAEPGVTGGGREVTARPPLDPSSSSSRMKLENWCNRSWKSVKRESLEGVPDMALELELGDMREWGMGLAPEPWGFLEPG